MKQTLSFALLLFTSIVLAQNTPKKIDLSQGKIDQKFDELYQKSNNYKQYKVVEHGLLLELKKQVMDSLQAEKKQTTEALSKIDELQNKITGLEKDLNEAQQKIEKLSAEKQNISFLGIPTSKEKFKLVVGLLLFVLFLALSYFIYAFRSSNILTREAKRNLAKVEEEYFSFKTQALEREQLLKRQLLDEQKKHQ